ncbi:MAG: DNA gyrase inhibitor YacG [Paracoccaceae bacterium]
MSCPICARPTDPEHRPFCSARCREVDLGRWLTGGYRIPGPPTEDEAEPQEAPPDPTPPRRPH